MRVGLLSSRVSCCLWTKNHVILSLRVVQMRRRHRRVVLRCIFFTSINPQQSVWLTCALLLKSLLSITIHRNFWQAYQECGKIWSNDIGSGRTGQYIDSAPRTTVPQIGHTYFEVCKISQKVQILSTTHTAAHHWSNLIIFIASKHQNNRHLISRVVRSWTTSFLTKTLRLNSNLHIFWLLISTIVKLSLWW